jgi:hypothetical protein
LSGNGNTGTLINGVGYNGGNSGSLVFDGVDDYINVGNSISNSNFGNNNFSLGAWFKWVGGGGGTDLRVYLLQNGGSNFPLTLEINARDFTPPRFATWEHTTSGSTHHNSPVNVDANTWYYFVVSKGLSNTIKMFVNGVEIFSTGERSGNLTEFNGLKIGTYRSNNDRWFNGDISQVSIYNRALTAQEIQQNFNAIRGRFGI